jgi:hydroxymethylbilane synthase
MKDVPAEMPDGFCIAAVLPRATPYDALLSRSGKGFAELPHAATIGSSSLRRQAQLRALRSDVQVVPLRGNVNTRLAKLAAGDYDAIVLACAGLERLGLDAQISERFDPEQMLPAAAQGVIGVECLGDRDGLRQVLIQLEHGETRYTTTAERAVARRLQASCQSPVASFATLHGDDLTLLALVASVDGSTLLREEITGSSAEAEALGIEAADRLLARGAASLLDTDRA